MEKAPLCLGLWLLAAASAMADLSFGFNSPDDVAVTAPGYSASGPLDLTLNFQPTPGRNLTVIRNTGPAFISGTFDAVPQGAVVPLSFNGVTYRYLANYHGDNGRSLVLQWPELQVTGWGGDLALQGSATTGFGASPSLLANEGGLAGKVVLATSASSDHALVLTADGKIFAWGNNSYGQLGDGTSQATGIPVQVDDSGALAGKTVVAITAGSLHSLALTSDGQVFAWGDNGSGRLGDGTTETRRVPVAVDRTGALAGKSVVAIAAGQYHSLALASDGRVYAWGYGFQGQLGDGTIDNRISPVAVVATGVLAGKSVIGISAGFYHSVAATSDGTVAAWGFNTNGQLGNNSTSPSPLPVVAAGSLAGKRVTAVRAGANFNLALTDDGQVHAWGSNGSGQLGIGTTADSRIPTLAGGSLAGKTVTAIAAGDAHGAALTRDGQPHVWGSDGNGQLGNGVGPETPAPSPVPVPGLGPASGKTVAALFAGGGRSHALADPGAPRRRADPLNLTANPGATARFTATVSHPFPVSARWQISASGAGGPFQDITDEPSANTGTLTLGEIGGIPHGAAFRAVFSSLSGSVISNPAVLSKTEWPATFAAASGPLATVTSASVAGNLAPVLGFEPAPGTELTLIRNTGPAPIRGRFANILQGATVPLTFNGVTYRFVANYHGGNGRSLVLQWPSMGLFGWGRGDSGLFGSLGSSQTLPVGIPITGAMAGKTITGMSHSGGHVLALTADGKVFAWGGNGSGQLGVGSTTASSQPVAVEGGALAGKSVVALSAGDHHSLAVTSEGRVVVWGRLRTGYGSTPNSLLPVELSPGGPLAGQTVVAISAGGTFDLALTASGEIFGWGGNSFGQLGSYNTQYQPDPVLIGKGEIGSRVVTAIAAGSDHALALTEDGAVFAWGSNQYGSLGLGNGTPGFHNPVPVRVGAAGALAGKTITAIAAVSSRGMALTDDGQVFGWGINWNGELGNGGTASGLVPVAVDTSGALAGKFVTTLACGSSHTAVLTRDRSIFAWGDNGNGELGYPGWEDSLVPVEVATGVMAGATPAALTAGWDSSLALVGHGAPAITRHPMDFMAAAGQTATFTATATDPFPFVVKWQVSPAGAAGPFGDIAGNAGTLTVPGITAAQDGWAYRAVFVSDAGQRATAPAVLRVVEWSASLSSAAAVPFGSMRVLASGPLDLDLGFAPTPGANLTLVRNSGPEFIAGTFDNIPQGGLVTLTHAGTSYPFFANYFGGNGRSLVLQWPWTAVAGWGQSLGASPVAVGTRPALAEDTLVALRGGPGHQLALTADGKVFAWGSGNQGQLGSGGTSSSQVPVPVMDTGALAGKTLVAVATGDSFSLGLSADGEVFSWGSDFNGQLGDGTSGGSRTEPVAVVADGALAGRTVTAIAAGADHGLALTADGEVFAWGDNSRDQLGTEDWRDSAVPVAVDTRGALSGKTLVAIAAGENHSLAVTADGEVIAWGENTSGKLGNGSTTDPGIPVKVDASGALAGKRVVAVAAGAHHSAALTADGLVFTWGSNSNGQLGNNEVPNSSAVPVAVTRDGVLAGRSVVSISASGNHCLAVAADGEIFSWGWNASGQLGNGGTVTRPAPVAIGSAGALAAASVHGAVAAGSRSFALLGVAGSPLVTTVPRSHSFILGAGAAAPSVELTAAALDPLTLSVRWQEAGPTGDFSDMAGNPGAITSTIHLSGLTVAADGRRYRAVFSNAGGSTATLPATLAISPAESTVTLATATGVPFTARSPVLDGSLDIALGFAPVPGAELTLVRNTGGDFISGGFTNLVQGAVIQLSHSGIPHAFEVDYFGGNGRSLVLRWANSLAAAWGNGSSGQLGAGNSTATNRTPVAVVASGTLSGQAVAKLAAGTSHSLALASSGRIFAWGANPSGQLGNGTTAASNLPVEVDASGVLAGKRAIAIAAGSAHSLALTADGQVAAWGSDSNGQLGNGASAGSTTAVTVTRDAALAGTTVIAIAAGQLHSVALASDGTLVAWGSNLYGQLGNGTTTTAQTPVAVVANGALAGKTVTAIAAGTRHTLALTADGRVFSWGSNQAGQLGNGSGNPTATSPAAISGGGLINGKTVVAIAAGDSHSLALTSDGKAYAWGLGSQGQLGTGFTSGSYAPVAVQTSGALAGKSLVAIAAGGSHSLAIGSDGPGYAWGGNDYGQLGNNVRPSLSPEAMSTQGAIGSRPLMAIAAGTSHSLALAARGGAPVITESPLSKTVAAGTTVTLTASADGYPSPTVRWQRSTTGPGGTFSNMSGQTTPTLELSQVTPSQTGYAYRAVFTNLEASATSAVASLTVQPTFENFLVSRGLPADAPPTDDPFHTGIPLRLAFAFDLDPISPDRTKLPAVSFVGGKLRVSYTRWRNAPDLHHTVEVSHGLDHWISGPDVTEVISVTPLGNTRETVVEQEILADPSPAGFVRVRVELDSP